MVTAFWLVDADIARMPDTMRETVRTARDTVRALRTLGVQAEYEQE
jgi:hypothetical protein